jgi:hypothetical protein
MSSDRFFDVSSQLSSPQILTSPIRTTSFDPPTINIISSPFPSSQSFSDNNPFISSAVFPDVRLEYTSDNKFVIYKHSDHERFNLWWKKKSFYIENYTGDKPKLIAVHWGKEKKSAAWDYFVEVARVSDGVPYLKCKFCKDYLLNPLPKGSGPSSLAKHRRKHASEIKAIGSNQITIQAGFDHQASKEVSYYLFSLLISFFFINIILWLLKLD